MLDVQKVMQIMRQHLASGRPRPFSITYCTADRNQKKGGEIRELPKAILLTQKRTSNRLLNLQPLGTKDIVRVHLDLILYFNDQPVL